MMFVACLLPYRHFDLKGTSQKKYKVTNKKQKNNSNAKVPKAVVSLMVTCGSDLCE